MTSPTLSSDASVASLVLGGGCFWCLEALYQRLGGVLSVQSGYAGGTVPNPTYKAVCTGQTGHAEVVEIRFDPAIITLRELVDFFWEAHDPTTLNRQGADVGTQYRSALYFQNAEQAAVFAASREAAQKRFAQPIVTEVAPLTVFYPAESEHDDYYNRHQDAPYCRFVIAPKMRKLEAKK